MALAGYSWQMLHKVLVVGSQWNWSFGAALHISDIVFSRVMQRSN
jgi:hypothetical protein